MGSEGQNGKSEGGHGGHGRQEAEGEGCPTSREQTACGSTSLTAPPRESLLPASAMGCWETPHQQRIGLQSAADTCPALLFDGGRCPMPWGRWPRRKCFCLCSPARLPMLLGTQFSLPSFLTSPRSHPTPPPSSPACLTCLIKTRDVLLAQRKSHTHFGRTSTISSTFGFLWGHKWAPAFKGLSCD